MDRDMVIIGGGPGGYVSAIRAAQLGAKVTVVEQRELGGTCLNRGCIPTKALFRNAEIIHTLQRAHEFGVKVGAYELDIEQIHTRKQQVVDSLVGGVAQLLKANGVEVLRGRGEIRDPHTVVVTADDGSQQEIFARNIVIATGSDAFIPPIPGADLPGVITSDEILNFKSIPKRLAIIGGGVIGMEFAGIFNALGSEVTVVEFLPSILARVDSDLTKRLTISMKKRGMQIHTGTKVTAITQCETGLVVQAEGKKGSVAFEVDSVLVSVGRAPRLEGLNLAAVGVAHDRKGIKVDGQFMTNVPGIYAIGDVIGGAMLAHVASHQGKAVAESVMGLTASSTKHEVVPACIFVSPEISTVGLTEEEAKEQGIAYKVSKFMFGANGKALSLGEPEGLVKVIATAEDSTLLGVHIMGPHASDLIHEGTLALSQGLKAKDISSAIHAHPTLAEAFDEAVAGLDSEAIHMTPSRARKDTNTASR